MEVDVSVVDVISDIVVLKVFKAVVDVMVCVRDDVEVVVDVVDVVVVIGVEVEVVVVIVGVSAL